MRETDRPKRASAEERAARARQPSRAHDLVTDTLPLPLGCIGTGQQHRSLPLLQQQHRPLPRYSSSSSIGGRRLYSTAAAKVYSSSISLGMPLCAFLLVAPSVCTSVSWPSSDFGEWMRTASGERA